nr:endoplasmic reticulum protein [Cryptococcus depauperatus CBS 7841]
MSLYELDYTISQSKATLSIPNPPGYTISSTSKQLSSSKVKMASNQLDADVLAKKTQKSTELKMKRAWDLALSPAKSLPMQAIMLYFSGSGVQIFSLGMIFMLLTQPLTAIFNIFRGMPTPPPKSNTAATQSIEEPSYAPLIGPMIVYVACQGLTLFLGLYKCSSMGILPTGSGDWLHFETRSDPPEWSAIRALSI